MHWNRQPSADNWDVSVAGSEVKGGQFKTITDWRPGWGDPTSATHEVTFTGLPPDTEYQVTVEAPRMMAETGDEHAVEATATVRTTVAPASHTPLVRGPQNLRATATHDTITVRWDHPRPDTGDLYRLYIAGPYGGGFVHDSVWPPDSQYTFDDLLPNSTYLIRVTHNDIVRETAEITITTKAAGPPLRLTLTAERAECTAGTLNPVSWEIEGGVEPYRLAVDGASVDADAESATVTCGALPEGATEAPGTITATVTDATGAPATASAAYTIVPPLPAPTGLGYRALRTHTQVWWDDVTVLATAPSATPDCPCPLYLLRWRAAGTDAWTAVLRPVTPYSRPGNAHGILTGLSEGTTYGRPWPPCATRSSRGHWMHSTGARRSRRPPWRRRPACGRPLRTTRSP